MRNKILLFTTLFVFTLNTSAQESVINNVFEKYVEVKISSMQNVIDITDYQAKQLKVAELNYLLDVNSAENCWWYNTKKRVEKLKKRKEAQLKEILNLDQYIKYDAIDNKKIKKHPMWIEYPDLI